MLIWNICCCRGSQHWTERLPQRAFSLTSDPGECHHHRLGVQRFPRPVEGMRILFSSFVGGVLECLICVWCFLWPASVPSSSAALPRRLWGSLSPPAACQLRLGSTEGLAAGLPGSGRPPEEGLQVWVQGSSLWEQPIWKGEQHSASPSPWERWGKAGFRSPDLHLLLCCKPPIKLTQGEYIAAFHAAPSSPPLAVSITVSHEQNNTVHLSWEPPPPDSHNGVVQGYQVTAPCLAPLHPSTIGLSAEDCSSFLPLLVISFFLTALPTSS